MRGSKCSFLYGNTDVYVDPTMQAQDYNMEPGTFVCPPNRL